MLPLIIFALVAAVLGVYRVTTAEERKKLLSAAQTELPFVLEVAASNRERCKPFNEALRARNRRALVASALIVANAAVFALLLWRGAPDDLRTLVAWGGSVGPRTTNGEWWRLVTASFLHVGLLQLILTLVVLLDLGVALERLIGRIGFAVVYIGAGILFNLMRMSDSQIAVIVGSSGAVCGLYGALLAWLCWGLPRQSPLAVPVAALVRYAAVAVLFAVYTALTGELDHSAGVALAFGFASGLILLIGAGENLPSRARLATAAAAGAVLAVAFAFPLRGIVDARPEIEKVLALEAESVSTYKAALDRFQRKGMTIEALAQTIDRAIMPPLEAADMRLHTLGRVAREQQGLVTDAQKYAQLRQESWRLRSAALRQMNERVPANRQYRQAETQHRANISMFGQAEERERASLDALKRAKTATSSATPSFAPTTPASASKPASSTTSSATTPSAKSSPTTTSPTAPARKPASR